MPLPPVPCGLWTTDADVRECCPGLAPEFDLTNTIRFVSAILYRLSGRRWPGVCERTVLPCKGDNCGCSAYGSDLMMGWHWALSGYPSSPVRVENGFTNCWHTGAALNATGCCEGRCHVDCVDLPGPIDSIIEVVIDGEVLDPSAYKVQARRRICRVDGGSWPCSNDYTANACATTDTAMSYTLAGTGDYEVIVTVGEVSTTVTLAHDTTPENAQVALSAALGASVTVSGAVGDLIVVVDVRTLGVVPVFSLGASTLVPDVEGEDALIVTVVEEGCIGAPGTWQITYGFGSAPPLDGAFVAALFACEAAKDRCGGDSCLPKRLKEINREGVSMAFADPLEFLDDGKVGIYEVDLWLRSVNPNRNQRRALVRRADAPKPPRTWT